MALFYFQRTLHVTLDSSRVLMAAVFPLNGDVIWMMIAMITVMRTIVQVIMVTTLFSCPVFYLETHHPAIWTGFGGTGNL